jgi:hypothetical protein
MEYSLRKSINLENEVSTSFDFIMYYMKLWKMTTQEHFQSKREPLSENLYDWLSEIEGLAYDLTKSLLIDVRSLKFAQSISVCSLITVSIFLNSKLTLASKDSLTIDQLMQANQCWDNILKKLFG